MRCKMRREALTSTPEAARRAAADLLAVYAGLAERQAHLLGGLLAGATPRQWERLPADDAVDVAGRYQWFYHSHAPEDRPEAQEHGHIHLFARRALWESLPVTRDERTFQQRCGNPGGDASTRHLIAIGIDPKGLPISIFTVNSWVTGDLMLGADATAKALADIELDTGHPDIDRMIVALTRLCDEDIRRVLDERDKTLTCCDSPSVLEDRTIEILSEIVIDLDERIVQALRG